jgi:polyisoprenoid-binding protein YceI
MSALATVAAASIDTSFPGRDTYIRGSDVLAADEHEDLSFRSARVRAAGDGYLVDGDLTIRGITRPVTLAVELGGFADDPTEGGTVAGFCAAATISRTDFGFSEKIPPAIIGDKVDIYLDIQAVLAT